MSPHDRPPASVALASPPCRQQEAGPLREGLSAPPDPYRRKEVLLWRKAERERLIRSRLAIDSETRRDKARRLSLRLQALIGDPAGLIVSAYWPFRGEPDLREMMKTIDAARGLCALPVAVARGQPLIFRAWRPGEPLERGEWNIPVPSEKAEIVTPDIVIAPVVGFDTACFRLGYGGGFFDRTLAALPKRPRLLGVGYAEAAIPTIFPLPHDIPLDLVVTPDEVVTPGPPSEAS